MAAIDPASRRGSHVNVQHLGYPAHTDLWWRLAA